jgi:hypothetical protein
VSALTHGHDGQHPGFSWAIYVGRCDDCFMADEAYYGPLYCEALRGAREMRRRKVASYRTVLNQQGDSWGPVEPRYVWPTELAYGIPAMFAAYLYDSRRAQDAEAW